MTSDLRFDHQVAIVTGAGRGLGRAYALLLAARGAKIVVNDLGCGPAGGTDDPDVAFSTVGAIEAAGGEALANQADVADPNAVGRMFEAALDRWGRLDVVFNNAGITGFTLGAPAETASVLGSHLVGTINTLRAALPHLRAFRYGRIVNTSSASVFGTPNTGDYAAAKGGVFALTRVLATELRDEGVDIKVNVVMPVGATRRATPARAAYAEGVPATSAISAAELLEAEFQPEKVAAFIGLLAHESVPCSGEAFLVGAGRAARVLLQTSRGHHSSQPSPEDYLSHWDDIIAGLDLRDATGGLQDLLSRLPESSVFGA